LEDERSPIAEADTGAAKAPLRRLEPSLPARWYFDPEQYRRELDAVWLRSWLYVCRAEEVARPRDFAVFDVADQSVLLLRDLHGTLRAFHNVCRHRGSLLCAGARGRFTGGAIVCPYHGWTYSLEGELRGARHQLPAPDLRREDYPLYRVAVAEWGGFVFVNPSGDDAPPLLPAFDDDGAEELSHWSLERLSVGHRSVRVAECNWKVFWENFLECFHCPGVHPELSALVPAYGRGLLSDADDPAWTPPADGREAPGLAPGAVTWSEDGRTALPHFPELRESDRRRGQTFAVCRPGFFAVGHVDYVRAVRVLPRGPERTELVAEWLYAPEVLERPDFDAREAARFGERVVEQDARICEVNQRGLHARAFEAGVLVPQEYAVLGFHEWLRARLGDTDR